ncbi:MAG: ABC transporter permease [Clostridia bacterium]|nr:ABC transporter permease [Clostridia bacterium]
MSNNIKAKREPLFHIVKREDLKIGYKILIYAVAILLSLFIGGVISSLASKGDPFTFFASLIDGCFGSPRKIWVFLQQMALLLSVSMALVPAFKMKFWNLGGNGQILIGGLAAIACMFYMGGKADDTVIVIVAIFASAIAGAIWAVIPALCKAFFNTNESLLTLMLNYIATGLVTFFLAVWVKSGSGVLEPIKYGNLPALGNPYLLIILFGVVMTAIIFVYLRYSKHGYELSVVGDSPNTARYIGINVKMVVIRTMILSGAICGLVGLLLTSGMSHTIGVKTAQNMGFTAIMTTWLGNCNPLMIISTCGLVTFVTKGMEQVRMDFGLTNDSIANLIIGLVYFFIIACAFFIQYKVVFNVKLKNKTAKAEVVVETATETAVIENTEVTEKGDE